MKRRDGRRSDELRNINIERNFIRNTEGSCLIELGNTKVICTAAPERNVPLFLRGSGKGWLTSEYAMLPRSAQVRIPRDRISGRSKEIQRLIGRCLRSVVDLNSLGERTILIDCDVIQADGGTRIASVIGGFVALVDCLNRLCRQRVLDKICVTDLLGAISVGICKGSYIADLTFAEDSEADVDMNIVMKAKGEFVEVQGTAEKGSFSQKDLNSLIELGKRSIVEVIDLERNLFKDILPNL